MSQNNKPFVIVIGNEKGGAGKTTCAMHIAMSIVDLGLRVTTIDVDCRQHSFTRYIENRKTYNSKHNLNLPIPRHFLLKESTNNDLQQKENDEKCSFETVIARAFEDCDFIIIDTPGSHTFLSRLAHSYADLIITPINDSFVDLDVLARIDGETLDIIAPAIYSQTIWEQKMEKAKRNRGTIEWVVMRNRLSNLDARNKRNISTVLEKLSKRISFRLTPGFSERVIFRELFLQGLTLLDFKNHNLGINFSLSHVAARQELRDFLKSLNISQLQNLIETA